MARPLYEIADEIARDWGSKVSPAARPYVDALRRMDTVAGGYGFDTGEDVILRFLGNATGWRGEVAKRVKAELRSMVK